MLKCAVLYVQSRVCAMDVPEVEEVGRWRGWRRRSSFQMGKVSKQ